VLNSCCKSWFVSSFLNFPRLLFCFFWWKLFVLLFFVCRGSGKIWVWCLRHKKTQKQSLFLKVYKSSTKCHGMIYNGLSLSKTHNKNHKSIQQFQNWNALWRNNDENIPRIYTKSWYTLEDLEKKEVKMLFSFFVGPKTKIKGWTFTNQVSHKIH